MYFTKDHEWIKPLSDGTALIGISAYAAGTLGDIVFVELPEIGRVVRSGEAFCVVESVKAASDVYAPVACEVIEINSALASSPEMINADPQGEGFFCKVRLKDRKDLDGLMQDESYSAFVADL